MCPLFVAVNRRSGSEDIRRSRASNNVGYPATSSLFLDHLQLLLDSVGGHIWMTIIKPQSLRFFLVMLFVEYYINTK